MLELYVMICFLTAKWKTVAEIHRVLVQKYEYGENCIDVSNVRRWKRDFENNHCVLLENKQHIGWLANSFPIDNICHVRKILKTDDCFTVAEIIAHMPPVGCGWSTIHTIIHDLLKLQKLSCWWEPHILTDNHMRHMGVSLQFLTLLT